MDKAWKRLEREVARKLGTVRTPLSGGRSRITRGDIIHDRLYVEVKYSKRIPGTGLWDSVAQMAAGENKIPVLVKKVAKVRGLRCEIDFDLFCQLWEKAGKEIHVEVLID